MKINSYHYNIVKEKISCLVPKSLYVVSLEIYFSCSPEYSNLALLCLESSYEQAILRNKIQNDRALA